MLIIPNQYKFRPSNNIKYLERILDIPIMSAIQADVDEYLLKMSKGITSINGLDYPFAITTKESRNIFTVSLDFNNKSTKLIQLKNGLPYINNTLMIGSIKSLNEKIGIQRLLMTRSELTNVNQLCLTVKDKITKLVIADMELLDNHESCLSKNVSQCLNILNNKIFKQATLLRGRSRIHSLMEKRIMSVNGNPSYMVERFTLLDCINYDIDKYIAAINKSIKFWFFVELRRIFLPKYQASLKELEPRLKLAGKMKLTDKYFQSLVKLPKTTFLNFNELYKKYQLGYLLIERHKELKAFDINKLIANNAHPKDIKDLIVNFYIENSQYKLTEKMITKILRYNIRLFSRAEATMKNSVVKGFLSPEHYLMVIFSDMPQISLLDSPRKNRIEIAQYADVFLDTFKFCTKFKNELDAMELTKSILRKNLHNNHNYVTALHNARVELRRLFEVFTQHDLIVNGLSQVKMWSIKKLVALHDSIGTVISLYYNDYENARTNPEILKHIESKIIEPVTIEGYRFTQLTTYNELQTEGRIMQHCVGGYFRSNYHDNLFIFNVSPINEPENKIADNYSTLAIYCLNKKFRISQNFTNGNEYPSEENDIIVDKFIKHIQKKHLSSFINYKNKSYTYRKENALNNVTLDENIYINKLIINLQ